MITSVAFQEGTGERAGGWERHSRVVPFFDTFETAATKCLLSLGGDQKAGVCAFLCVSVNANEVLGCGDSDSFAELPGGRSWAHGLRELVLSTHRATLRHSRVRLQRQPPRVPASPEATGDGVLL